MTYVRSKDTSFLTVELVSELFEYRSGHLYFKKRVSQRVHAGARAGTLGRDGYISVQIKRRGFKAHRIIFLMHHGWLPDEIDHINRKRTDNRITNLRAASHSENQQNRWARGTHEYKPGRWMAQIWISGVHHYLGTFNSEKEARKAYIRMKDKHHVK